MPTSPISPVFNRNVPDEPRDSELEVTGKVDRAPQPGAESAGPLMYDLLVETKRSAEVARYLLEGALRSDDRAEIDTVWPFTFDASGNFAGNNTNPMYSVPQGKIIKFTRFVFDVVGFTPAVPYSAAAAWQGLYRDAFAVGNLIDFAPASPGGPIFPGVYEYNESSAPRLFGGSNLIMKMVGTAALANLSGVCRIRGVQENQQ